MGVICIHEAGGKVYTCHLLNSNFYVASYELAGQKNILFYNKFR